MRFALAVSALILTLAFFLGPVTTPDFTSYVEGHVTRAPVYPLLLKAARLLFGGRHLLAVVAFQAAFVLAAAFCLLRTLDGRFGLSRTAFRFCFLLLAFPLVPVGFRHGAVANHILTEALAYGVFLLGASFLVRSVFNPTTVNAAALALLAALNVLIKPQFSFMYAALALFAVFFLRLRAGSGKCVLLLVLVGVFAAAAGIADRAWHRRSSGSFRPTAGMGYHLAGSMLYLSDGPELAALAGPEGEAFREAHARLDARRLLARYRHETGTPIASLHVPNYDLLIWEEWKRAYEARCGAGKSGQELMLAFEGTSKSIAFSLMKTHWKDYGRLVISKLVDKWTLGELFFMAFLVLLPFLGRVTGPEIAALLSFSVIMNFLNHLWVAAMTSMGERFLFPTEILMLALLAVVADLAFREPGPARPQAAPEQRTPEAEQRAAEAWEKSAG